eukprot:9355820-Pyramimonas_sp.AAC.1
MRPSCGASWTVGSTTRPPPDQRLQIRHDIRRCVYLAHARAHDWLAGQTPGNTLRRGGPLDQQRGAHQRGEAAVRGGPRGPSRGMRHQRAGQCVVLEGGGESDAGAALRGGGGGGARLPPLQLRVLHVGGGALQLRLHPQGDNGPSVIMNMFNRNVLEDCIWGVECILAVIGTERPVK